MDEQPIREKSEERDYGEVLIEIYGILDLAMAIYAAREISCRRMETVTGQ